jgi:membrane protease YdiL (CAAX protease family)
MKELAESTLQQHPELQAWLGWLVLLSSACAVLVLFFCWKWRAEGRLVFNQMPKLPLDLQDIALFLAGLYLLLNFFSVAGFHSYSFHLAILATIALHWHWRRLPWRRHLGWRRASLGTVLWSSAFLTLAIYLPIKVLIFVSELTAERLGQTMDAQDAVKLFFEAEGTGPVAAMLFFAVILAPVAEELLFRGYLQPFLKSWLPARVALILTALAFAAIHGHWPTFLPLFGLGLVLGLVYEYTGAWWRCVGLHAGFNALNAAFMLLIKSYQ